MNNRIENAIKYVIKSAENNAAFCVVKYQIGKSFEDNKEQAFKTVWEVAKDLDKVRRGKKDNKKISACLTIKCIIEEDNDWAEIFYNQTSNL